MLKYFCCVSPQPDDVLFLSHTLQQQQQQQQPGRGGQASTPGKTLYTCYSSERCKVFYWSLGPDEVFGWKN